MEPPADVLLGLNTVGMVMTWIGIDDINRAAMHSIMGTTDASHPRTVAGIPIDAFDAAFLAMQLTVIPMLPRELTLAERNHIGILRETCCLAAGTKKTSAALRAEAETEAKKASDLAIAVAKRDPETALVPTIASKRVKLDTVINQHDTTEITMMPRSELDRCYAVFNKKFGDGDVNSEPVVPRPDEEATAEQLSSLKAVVESGEPP